MNNPNYPTGYQPTAPQYGQQQQQQQPPQYPQSYYPQQGMPQQPQPGINQPTYQPPYQPPGMPQQPQTGGINQPKPPQTQQPGMPSGGINQPQQPQQPPPYQPTGTYPGYPQGSQYPQQPQVPQYPYQQPQQPGMIPQQPQTGINQPQGPQYPYQPPQQPGMIPQPQTGINQPQGPLPPHIPQPINPNVPISNIPPSYTTKPDFPQFPQQVHSYIQQQQQQQQQPNKKYKQLFKGIPRKSYETGYYCDICKKKFSKGNSFWHCPNKMCKDDFDICEQCKKQAHHSHELDHYTGSPISGSPSNYHDNLDVKCDKCHKNQLKSFFHKGSGYDLCNQCFEIKSNDITNQENLNDYKYYDKSNKPTGGCSVTVTVKPCYPPQPKYPSYPQQPQYPFQAQHAVDFKTGVPSSLYSNGFNCDYCKKTSPSGVSFYHCSKQYCHCSNKYDLCGKCFKTSAKNHSHKWTQYSGKPISGKPSHYSLTGNICCDKCKKSGLQKFFHKLSNYDLCENCFKNEKYTVEDYKYYDKSSSSFPIHSIHPIQPFLPLKNNNTITIGVPRFAYKNGFNCDNCKKHFGAGKTFLHCNNHPICKDNYDLCETCHKNVNHYHTMKCYSGEAVKKYNLGIVRCDLCKKSNLSEYFHKDNQNYDLCKTCYEKRANYQKKNDYTYTIKTNQNPIFAY